MSFLPLLSLAACTLLYDPRPRTLDGTDDADLPDTGEQDTGDPGEEIPPTCGNGFTDPGEECDDGNPTGGDGCESNCTFTCQNDADCSDGHGCTEDACNTGTHVCRHTTMGAGEICRPSTQPCDIEETCDGASPECPMDSLADHLFGVLEVTAGEDHTCARLETGGIMCWGNNEVGQLGDGTHAIREAPVQVVGLSSGVAAISGGGWHTCALMETGGVKCWGTNSAGQLGDGTNTERSTPVDVQGLSTGVAAISAGHLHTCALMETGAVKCWGQNGYHQLGDGTTTHSSIPVNAMGLASGAASVHAGHIHTCAIMEAGTVRCWGDNSRGQLGDGTSVEKETPTEITNLSGITYIAGGRAYYSCGITTAGGVKCWGENYAGQLGNGTLVASPTPVNVQDLSSGVVSLSIGGSHSCAVLGTGRVKCWGWNAYGQLGNGTKTDSSIPADVSRITDATSVSLGLWHACAVSGSGELQCWGRSTHGQLGDGYTGSRRVPTQVSGVAGSVSKIHAGYMHTCALTTSGAVKCWGLNGSGQLGDTTRLDKISPVDVTGLGSVIAVIAAGHEHSCGAFSGDGAKCWGLNVSGQLGNGTINSSLVPVDVTGLPSSNIVAMTAGAYHTCAVTSLGALKCWGYNSSGQIGDGTIVDRNSATDVSGLTEGVMAVSAGNFFTCALLGIGGVKCWGRNDHGQLGDGSYTDSHLPINVGFSSGVSRISAGYYHACALLGTGNLQCWGFNSHGQLGDGTTEERTSPVDVVGLASQPVDVDCGELHTCAILESGEVQCWGWNIHGQLGDGTVADSPAPVDVTGFPSDVSQISAGSRHTCAVTVEGDALCWGFNAYGQLGHGTTADQSAPVAVVCQ